MREVRTGTAASSCSDQPIAQQRACSACREGFPRCVQTNTRAAGFESAFPKASEFHRPPKTVSLEIRFGENIITQWYLYRNGFNEPSCCICSMVTLVVVLV